MVTVTMCPTIKGEQLICWRGDTSQGIFCCWLRCGTRFQRTFKLSGNYGQTQPLPGSKLFQKLYSPGRRVLGKLLRVNWGWVQTGFVL